MAQEKTSVKSDENVVIVTGSIIRNKNLKANAPITEISAVQMEKRGGTTIEAIAQTLPGNGGGAMTNEWSAGGNFAQGASAISLRSMTSNSTLTIVDGMRMAYYPLADDATRNFVDLNAIPNMVTAQMDVLQEGASSTYGADAIAGVVNVISRKEYKGLSGKIYGGDRFDSGKANYGGNILWGKGKLADDGYNLYFAAEYQHTDELHAYDLDYPYNTADMSGLCATSVVDGKKTCRTNGIVNGLQFDGTFTGASTAGTGVAVVRPYLGTSAKGDYQLINPSAGCGSMKSVTVGTAMVPGATATSGYASNPTFCQLDVVNKYAVLNPESTRASFAVHGVKDLSDNLQIHFMFSGYQYKSHLDGTPQPLRSGATAGQAGTTFSLNATNSIYGSLGSYLPVYVCPIGTVTCTSANGTLNPNNPFASQGYVARIFYRFEDIPRYTETTDQVFRFATGIDGSAGKWNYSVDLAASDNRLTYERHGVLYLNHLVNAINSGMYNFVNPSANTQATRDYIAPVNTQNSVSQLIELKGIASRDLFDLPGGMSTIGLGLDTRWESIDNRSANPDPIGGDPTMRWTSAINPFGAVGGRSVHAAFFELNAPVLKGLDLNLGGRYDKYSTGQSAFSPKLSGRWEVMPTLAFRGSISKGFRAPSIAETNSDPTTGFVSYTSSNTAWKASHGNNTYASAFSIGKTTIAAKDLKPEKSTGASLGVVYRPLKNIDLSLDYYKITKKDVIMTPSGWAAAVEAFLAGQTVPDGYKIVADEADTLYPNAIPRVAYVIFTRQNLAEMTNSGFDFSANGRFNLFNTVKWNTGLQASYISYYKQKDQAGNVERFDGTLGNNDITSGSGTPKWKGNWQNTFEYGNFSTTFTTYYTGSYNWIAMDQGDTWDQPCAAGLHTISYYRDGKTPVVCEVKPFIYTDAHFEYKVNENYTGYVDIGNIFNNEAPYDPNSSYGSTGYASRVSNFNYAFSAAGVIGRTYRIGMKFKY